MDPLTDREIERGIARRRLPNGSWIAYEICGDCNMAFERGAGKLGYGFSIMAKDHRGGTRYPNGHEADGRGRCRPCLEKRGVFSGRDADKPNLREMILATLNPRGSFADRLAKELKANVGEVREELARLIDEGRVWTKGKLYGKIVSEKPQEDDE